MDAVKTYVNQIALDRDIQVMRSSSLLKSAQKSLYSDIAALSDRLDSVVNNEVSKLMNDHKVLEVESKVRIEALNNRLSEVQMELKEKDLLIDGFVEKVKGFETLLDEKENRFEQISTDSLAQIKSEMVARDKREELNEEMFGMVRKRLSEVEMFADNQP